MTDQKQIYIVGCSIGISTHLARLTAIESSANQYGFNIVHVDTINDVPNGVTSKPPKQSPELLKIKNIEFEEPFYPKKKHSPKGHQRPYKYHR